MGRTNRILTGFVLNAHPFDNLPEEAWSELTDPVSFVVGSMLILFYRAKRVPDQSAPFDPVAVGGRIGATLGATPWVVMPVLIPVLVGLLFPQFGVGNSFWYAMTLLVAGAFTVVPSRLADLRDRKRVRGAGYPKTLRKVMWWIEVCIWFGAIVAILLCLSLSSPRLAQREALLSQRLPMAHPAQKARRQRRMWGRRPNPAHRRF